MVSPITKTLNVFSVFKQWQKQTKKNTKKPKKNPTNSNNKKGKKKKKKAFYVLKITEYTCTTRENLKTILDFNHDVLSALLREKISQMFC